MLLAADVRHQAAAGVLCVVARDSETWDVYGNKQYLYTLGRPQLNRGD